MRIFLDANILFSAAKSDGAIRQLLDLLEQAGHELVADGYVIEEARRNLANKSPQNVPALAKRLSRMRVASTQAGDTVLAASLPLPAKDRPVLAAAIHHGCAALVTGDRTHFGALYGRSVHGVVVHSPRSMAEALLK